MFMATTRGPYAKGKAKRAEILDVALEVIEREGYSGATVKQLAEAVELSQNGLLRYFGSKDALFTEILRRRDDALALSQDTTAPDFADTMAQGILDSIGADIAAPGLAQLTLRLTGEATEPDHVAHEFFRWRYETVREFISATIEELRSQGRVHSDIDSEIICNLIFASIDGLRIQWMYDHSIDVRAHIAHQLRALGLGEGLDEGLAAR